MKRKLIWVLIFSLLLMLLPIISSAEETGEMEIASERVEGAVGDMVKVDFYCYANLPEGQKLDSITGMIKYDPEILTIGAIVQTDEEANLTSFMIGKFSSPFVSNFDKENGIIKFVYIDAYGVDANGFWFQAEFRIEKEGATDFIFNGITYTGLITGTNEDGKTSYKSVSYTIEPRSVGGVYTAGESVPTDTVVDETFAPLTPAVETQPPKPTATPRPSSPGQTVPHTTTLPVPSVIPSASSGLVTPKPPVTSMPVRTPSPQNTNQATAGTTTQPTASEPGTTEPADITAEPTEQAEETSLIVAEGTPEATERIIEEPLTPTPEIIDSEPVSQPNSALAIAVIAGIVVVILLAILAIVLILIRNKRMNEQD